MRKVTQNRQAGDEKERKKSTIVAFSLIRGTFRAKICLKNFHFFHFFCTLSEKFFSCLVKTASYVSGWTSEWSLFENFPVLRNKWKVAGEKSLHIEGMILLSQHSATKNNNGQRNNDVISYTYAYLRNCVKRTICYFLTFQEKSLLFCNEMPKTLTTHACWKSNFIIFLLLCKTSCHNRKGKILNFISSTVFRAIGYTLRKPTKVLLVELIYRF